MIAQPKTLAIALTYLVLIAGTAAMAAQISSQARGSYQRLSFRFDTEPAMEIGGGGSTLVLKFNQPFDQPASAVAAQAPGYVKSASLSSDGKQLTLQLTKPFRSRQFRSSNSVGIDLIGTADANASAAQAAPVAAADPILSTKKPEPVEKAEPLKALPSSTKKKEIPLVKKSVTPSVASTKPVAPPKTQVAALPKTAPATAIKAAETPPAATPIAPAPDAMLSTKPAPAPTDAITTKAPEAVIPPEQPAAPAAVTVATPPPALESPKPNTEVKPPEKPAPFLVTSRTTGDGTVINFPWSQRTALAVFERARDIWLVFSRPADANVALMHTVLPKGVVDINQFAYAGNTVLRITTDGSIHASASQPKGGYGWDVTLGTSSKTASLEVPVSTESDGETLALLLAAYDVADPLKFFDPRIGDLLVVVPAFEAGRGIGNLKTYPELSVLASGQGITVASNRDDLTTRRSRSGILITAPDGLAISKNLSTLSTKAEPVPGISALSDVSMPYDKWYVAPNLFAETHAVYLRDLANAEANGRPDALMKFVSLTMGQGLAAEAAGYLKLIREMYPDYYTANKLALLDTAAAFMQGHDDEAAHFVGQPELADVAEAQLWREVVALSIAPPTAVQNMQQDIMDKTAPAAAPATPAPAAAAADEDVEPNSKAVAVPVSTKPAFRFLKWNKPYIHFYPPRVRQKLAVAAADAYLANGQEDKALSTYETLNRDGILAPLALYAKLTLAEVASQRSQPKEALEALDRLSEQHTDRYVQMRARYDATMLRFAQGIVNADDTAEALERILLSWRGDALQKNVLTSLAAIYREGGHYDDTLRTQRKIIDDFPGDPNVLQISSEMGQLFQDLFLTDKLAALPPLKTLALFYEFRDLTPVGDTGDAIIQKLADRLAAVDLLDRATQLLDNQIKNRLSGEMRSRVGARLALLYLLNHQPQQAVDVLQVTNFGGSPADLQTERLELTAQALSKLGKHEEALSLIYNDTTPKGASLRLEILWAMQDWPNVVNRAEDILGARGNLTSTLTPEETDVLLKLALAYAFENDSNQLRYLRDYYGGLVPDSAYKEIFNYITSDTTPLDPADVALLSKQISNTESFLSTFKAKIAAGKLSEALK